LTSPSSVSVRLRADLVQVEADRVIDGVPESLLAADVTLSCLDTHVAEQKLNLIQFSPGLVT
jgi:hypothetical protein